MLKNLSVRQKEIALSFIALFFISGFQSLASGMKNYRSFNQANYLLQFRKSPVSFSGNTRFTLPVDRKGPHTNAYPKMENLPGNETLPAGMDVSRSFIGGPSQPEMNAFKAIGADNMVSPFTGDFSYNIPLLDVGGYPVNMFYNSGINMDDDASWLGLGWNINPGTITRNMRGLPDDFDGTDSTDVIKKTQSFREDKTFGLTAGAGVRFAGFPISSAGASIGLAWNNKLGISAEAGLNAALSITIKNADVKTKELGYGAELNAGLNANSRSGASFSPTVKFLQLEAEGTTGKTTASMGVGYTYSSRIGLSSMHLDMNRHRTGKMANGDNYTETLWNTSGTLSFAYPSVTPTISRRFSHSNFSVDISAGNEAWGLFTHVKLRGYYSKTFIAPDDSVTYHPAYGMLNYEKGTGVPDALLDFNRANDGVYTRNTPTVGMPMYTYDVFTISGEGTGGSFRAYRGDVGHVNDAFVQTKEDGGSIGVDLGFANMLHVGADLSQVYSPTDAGDWKLNNLAAPAFSFFPSNGNYQASYFKNPGEKTVPDENFQAAVGHEDLVRLKLGNIQSAAPMLLPALMRYDGNKNLLGEKAIPATALKKNDRDKRTQVISFLTARESERIGMNTKIYSYNTDGLNENNILFGIDCNKAGIDSFYRNHDEMHGTNFPPIIEETLQGETVPFRRKNHISEIDVLGSDGRKYIYGIPVYNKVQRSVTFSVNRDQKLTNNKVQAEEDDATVENKKGRDWFVEKEEIPAYTHSYLLTELTSPNYVDITGNGISEDDMGDAVKFNYSKKKDFKWRTPIGSDIGSYSEGLKTDEKDDKAHYIYGEREAWYLYSIESKNMVARFYVKNDRKDGRAVMDEHGALDPDYGMQRLDKICLYSKADLVIYGNAAKPIKTVRFFQSYKLTPNVDNNSGACIDKNGQVPGDCNSAANINKNKGKLTLDSIWISYNGNNKKPKSRYVFYYPENNNPAYSFDETDRWGSYKPAAQNPHPTLTNAEYPYSVQDKEKADKNAAAWTMNKILLPSGAVIKVDYESDSYAYVQDKAAANMYRILGFGKDKYTNLSGSEKNKLYNNDEDNDYVFVELPNAISNYSTAAGLKEFRARFFGNTRQVYMRLAVEMPTGRGLSGIAGNETIPVYADIDTLGLVSATIGWIKVSKLSNAVSPMAQAALQFLMQQLPGKAYKSYDMSEEGGMKSVISAMGGMLSSASVMIRGGETRQLRRDRKCQNVVLENSFLRLDDPTGNKFGGGLRVKRITISDNWTKMTATSSSGGMMKALYGQEYKYGTTAVVNGQAVTISSGVASWEPSIGGDENPHRAIMRYLNHNKGGPYDFGSVEVPLGESLYPSPSIGYSRIEILSIHRDTVKNLPVKQVTEFYTTKDFPYKSSATDLSNDANIENQPSKIKQLLKIDMMKSVTQSQGFLIETNDMNGKQKSNATYTATDTLRPFSYTENFYNIRKATDQTYTFNHSFPVIGAGDGKVANALIGRDIELMADFRQHHSETITANVSINFDGFMAGFLPIPLNNILQPVVREGLMYRSAALLKVVTHYGVLDSVVVIDKGSMVSTKNLLYDAETGNPLLTRTQNEHNAPVYNFSYPAHWAYSGMGPAYKNIDVTYKNLNFSHGILTNPPAGIFKLLESGDELYVVSNNMLPLFPSLPCDEDANNSNPWTTLARGTANKIWAVNTSQSGDGTNQWVFMDADGNPFNALNAFGAGADIRIVRSGKRNLLDQSVGSVTSLADPRITTEAGGISTTKLVFDSATKIIQSSVATFKNNWRVDNSFYKVIEKVDNSVYAKVKRLAIWPDDHLSVSWYHHWVVNREDLDNGRSIEKTDAMPLYKFTRQYKPSNHHTRFVNYRMNSFVLYSYNDLPPNANLYKASLDLYAHSNFPSFPAPAHPDAKHPDIHNSSNPQSPPTMLGEVRALNKGWYNTVNTTANADTWISNYFNSSPANVTTGRGIIPYPVNSWDSYVINGNIDNRINVTLPLLTNIESPLAQQNKIGLKMYLPVDEQEPSARPDNLTQYRCFWSPTAKSKSFFALPFLYYYYYVCGDTLSVDNPEKDPSINKLITCTSSNITGIFCRSRFTEKKAINPYHEGVLGNWRLDTTYAYYGERKEGSLAQVDTRSGGTIKDFKTFWNFAPVPPDPATPVYLSRNTSAAAVWVWNSTITQYNRKGYEIENTDPLGRFNSGIYGYNQQLPVAVANNARVREIMYDGFEDYAYVTNTNCISCPPKKYINYNTAVNIKTDSTQKHSGNFSLRLNAGESIKLEAPVLPVDDRNYYVRIKGAQSVYSNTALGDSGTTGTGLTATFFNHATPTVPYPPLTPVSSGTSAPVFTKLTAIKINQDNAGLSPATGVSPVFFSVKFEGLIQVPATGIYTFRTICDNGYKLKIRGKQLSSNAAWLSTLTPMGNGNETAYDTIMLSVGNTYQIEVSYYNHIGGYQFDLQWKTPGSYGYTTIPVTHLYPPGSTVFQSVSTATITCNKLDSVQVKGKALTDTFSLIPESKMLLSAWVKVGTADCCYPSTYADNNVTENRSNSITIAYNGGGTAATFQPAGNIIEGWQRYESIFTIPSNATSIHISLNNTTSASKVFFDDLRIHPFNANMKSFVYHSGNLRLMAELDENNYTSLYEYDDDGTLTRVKKETERGIKTITETRSATQKQIKTDD